jgi:hypothetical protein
MMQTAAAAVIIALCAAYAAWRLWRIFFRSEKEFDCSPEKCAGCPYGKGSAHCGPDSEKKS